MKRFPLHPLLFAAFPVVFLFARNAHLMTFGKAVLPLVVIVAIAIAVTALAMLLYRDTRKAAIAGSGFMLLALSYGHVQSALAGGVLGRDLVLLPVWIALVVLVGLFARRVRSIGEVTMILNGVAVLLLAGSVVNASSAVAARASVPQTRAGEKSDPLPSAASGGSGRDVYYLIFDRYGGPRTLDGLGFDNRPFLDALEDRGFYVAEDAVSNYPRTAPSLSSSLNLDYLDRFERNPGRDSSDWTHLYDTLKGSKVSRFLQKHGYRYAHVGSWWDPTADDPTAQVNYHYDKRSEFMRVLLPTTIVQPLAKRIGFLQELQGRIVSHNQLEFQFESVADVAKDPKPTYTFAHFLLPHEPFTYDAEGNFVDDATEKSRTFKENYLGQVEYANTRILKMIDGLLDVPDARKPILVIQADEGPHPQRRDGYLGVQVSWKKASLDELHFKFPILSTYYLPGKSYDDLYPSISPVNSFRTIFDLYFGTDLGRLPDRSYIFGDEKQPYQYEEVTEKVRIR